MVKRVRKSMCPLKFPGVERRVMVKEEDSKDRCEEK
jgi:hypothetical protein